MPRCTHPSLEVWFSATFRVLLGRGVTSHGGPYQCVRCQFGCQLARSSRSLLVGVPCGKLSVSEGTAKMWNTLPSIYIKTDNPTDLRNSLAAIAEASSDFAVVRDPAFPPILSLQFRGVSPHRDLSAQLIDATANEPKLIVEIRASTWKPDPPTYETYRAAAEATIKPLLAAHNRKLHTGLRMSIAAKKTLEAKLPPRCDAWFKRFSNHANKASPHPNDWRRFYDFVRYSRGKRVELSEQEMANLLVAEGFAEEVSTDIARAYRHICDYERPRNTAETLDYLHFRCLTKSRARTPGPRENAT
jgi:hypothetical protein